MEKVLKTEAISHMIHYHNWECHQDKNAENAKTEREQPVECVTNHICEQRNLKTEAELSQKI